MSYLIILLPILGWGFMPIIANFKKSTPVIQLLGTSLGAFVFAISITLSVKPDINWVTLAVGFTSGFLWGIGQYLQFKAISFSSVSKTMPLSNSSQLIITTILAVVLLKEWTNLKMYLWGGAALILIVVGMLFITGIKFEKTEKHLSTIYRDILLSSLFLSFYVLVNKLFNLSAYQIILPQSLGMLTVALYLFLKEHNYRFPNAIQLISYNLLTGLSWAIANLGVFIATDLISTSLSYVGSQFCVVVSTIGGIIIFNEKKNLQEWRQIILGFTIMLMGATLLGFI